MAFKFQGLFFLIYHIFFFPLTCYLHLFYKLFPVPVSFYWAGGKPEKILKSNIALGDIKWNKLRYKVGLGTLIRICSRVLIVRNVESFMGMF